MHYAVYNIVYCNDIQCENVHEVFNKKKAYFHLHLPFKSFVNCHPIL